MLKNYEKKKSSVQQHDHLTHSQHNQQGNILQVVQMTTDIDASGEPIWLSV